MIASVFLMQPVGQALAQLVGVWVLLGHEATYGLEEKQCGLNSLHEAECKKIADGIWRIVIGSGAVPALLAIIFRFFLYDCGLYTLEVKNKPGNALRDTQRVYGAPIPSSDLPMGPDGLDPSYSPSSYPIPKPIQFSRQDLYNYVRPHPPLPSPVLTPPSSSATKTTSPSSAPPSRGSSSTSPSTASPSTTAAPSPTCGPPPPLPR